MVSLRSIYIPQAERLAEDVTRDMFATAIRAKLDGKAGGHAAIRMLTRLRYSGIGHYEVTAGGVIVLTMMGYTAEAPSAEGVLRAWALAVQDQPQRTEQQSSRPGPFPDPAHRIRRLDRKNRHPTIGG